MAEYDNFVGKTNKEDNILSEYLGTPEEVGANDPSVHWKDMPEFIQNDIKPFKTLYVHFRNAIDYEEFQNLVGQKLTMKTKSIWHPELERNQVSLLKWID